MNIFFRFSRFIKYYLNIKSVYLNFRLLPFSKAIYLPIDCASNVSLKRLTGRVNIVGDLFFRGMIRIGYGDVTIIDNKYPRTILDITGCLVFKGPAHIGYGSSLGVGGELILGKNFRITARSTIVASKRVEFGRNCLLSWDILVMDTDFHDILNFEGVVINEPTEIVIGNKVWIGCRTTILKGTTIEDNNIIGANSLITKKYFGKNQIIAGQPGKILRDKVNWR